MSATLLATKLYLPAPTPALIPRPRLFSRLDEIIHSSRRLILVSAPAGYGKTTLLSQWAHHSQWPITWLSLDTEENDLAGFLAYLIAALQKVEAALGRETLAALRAHTLPPLPALLSPLLNDINALTRDCLLILDDYHRIEAQAVHAAVTFLLDHQPPTLRLAIGTRADPPLPIVRLRARGQLVEVRQADLCFTPDEAAALLKRTTGYDLSQSHVETLVERTEGWAAGLQMAGASLHGRDAARIGDFVRAFTGTHRHVLAYLVEEVLQRQPPEMQAFLLHTSILKRLGGLLCDAVVAGAVDDGQPAADTLRQLERTNLFITALDDRHEWYRYHPLFAELLQHRLREAHPDLMPALHRRAATWYEQEGHTAEAVAHWLAANEMERAADLIEQSIPSAWKRGELFSWGGWLKALPGEVVRARPGLCVYSAINQLLAVHSIADVEALVQLASDQDADGRWQGEIQTLRAAVTIFRGDLAGSIALAQEAVRKLPEANPLRGLANRTLSTALFLSGDLVNGCRLLEGDVLASQRAGDRLGRAASLRRLGTLHLYLGRLRIARSLYEQSLEVSRDAHGRPWPIAGRALIHLGELAYEWNDLSAAEEYAVEGIELLEDLLPAWTITGYLILARIRQTIQDEAGADEALRMAEALARETAPAVDNLLVEAYQTELALRRGQLAEAERHWELTAARDLPSPDAEALMSWAFLREIQQSLFVRLRLARGQPEQALAVLASLLEVAERQSRISRLIEALALQAVAHETLGNAAEAGAALRHALRLAEPEGYVRVFLDEGESLRALLQRLKTGDGRLNEYVSKLLNAFRKPVGRPVKDQDSPLIPQPLVEPLSERELEVLRLIADGLSNREIAQKLFLSLYTVKFHTYNLFGKLGVHSRTQALARARTLGVLPRS